MNCTHPVKIKKWAPNADAPLLVPCGKCTPCRVRRAQEWALRVEHELPYWDHACFIRLSYDDDHRPPNYAVSKRELQLFFKRLRKRLGTPLAYIACGEYGETTEREHYHALIMGYGKRYETDKEQPTLWAEGGNSPPLPPSLRRRKTRERRRGEPKYRWNGQCWDVIRNAITDAWLTPDQDDRPPGQMGHVTLGTATIQSARYIAGYTLKSNIGKLNGTHHDGRNAPFFLCSRGIGKRHCLANKERFRTDLTIRHNGKDLALPRYYTKILELTDEEKLKHLQKVQEEIIEEYTQRGINSKDLSPWLAEQARQKSKNYEAKRSITHGA